MVKYVVWSMLGVL